MSHLNSPVGSIRSSHMRLRVEASAHNHALSSLYSYVVDRFDTLLETDWSIVLAAEATHLEDIALRLHLWGESCGLSSHKTYTHQSYALRNDEELAAWTKSQLLVVDAAISALVQSSDEYGHYMDPSRAHALIAVLWQAVDLLVKKRYVSSSSLRTSVAAARSSLHDVVSPSTSASSGSQGSGSPTYRRSSTASSLCSPTTSTSSEDINFDSLDLRDKTEELENDGDEAVPVPDDPSSPEAILGVCSRAHSKLCRLRDLVALKLGSSGSTSAEPPVHGATAHIGREKETLTRLHQNLTNLITQQNRLIRFYHHSLEKQRQHQQHQQEQQRQQPQHLLHTLVSDLALTDMLQDVSTASVPIYAFFSNNNNNNGAPLSTSSDVIVDACSISSRPHEFHRLPSSSSSSSSSSFSSSFSPQSSPPYILGQMSRPSSRHGRHSSSSGSHQRHHHHHHHHHHNSITTGVFGEIVLTTFQRHLETCTSTLSFGIDSCFSLDQHQHEQQQQQQQHDSQSHHQPYHDLESEQRIARLAQIHATSESLVRSVECQTLALDALVQETWARRLANMKSLAARRDVEGNLAGFRSCWVYFGLVCGWVGERSLVLD